MIVQIPLWTIVTYRLVLCMTKFIRSDSSMDDCNPFTPTQKRVLQAGSDSSMDDCN